MTFPFHKIKNGTNLALRKRKKTGVMNMMKRLISYLSYKLHCCMVPDKQHVPLSGHDDVVDNLI